MADATIPTTVAELLTTAAKGIAHINQHREAMAAVALQAKANVQPPPAAGGEKK